MAPKKPARSIEGGSVMRHAERNKGRGIKWALQKKGVDGTLAPMIYLRVVLRERRRQNSGKVGPGGGVEEGEGVETAAALCSSRRAREHRLVVQRNVSRRYSAGSSEKTESDNVGIETLVDRKQGR